MKPKVYLETSVVSYLTSKPSRDLITASRQKITHDWWETEQSNYSLFISEAVISEAQLGDVGAAQKRLRVLRRIPSVEVSEAAVILARFLAKETPFPAAANLDALHIAISTVHKLDYILTWNFKHIANATIRSKLEVLCQSKGFILPTICTPEELVY